MTGTGPAKGPDRLQLPIGEPPLARGDQEAHELVVIGMIDGIEFPPAVELIDVGLEMIDQVALGPAGELWRSAGVDGRKYIAASAGKEVFLIRRVLGCKFDTRRVAASGGAWKGRSIVLTRYVNPICAHATKPSAAEQRGANNSASRWLHRGCTPKLSCGEVMAHGSSRAENSSQ